MATDNNVNEFENGNENEVNEAPETAKKLSKHAQKKRYKDHHAQLKKRKMIEKNIKSAWQQSQMDVEKIDEKQVNAEPKNEARAEAENLRASEPKVAVTGQGLRAFLDDEEDEPQIQERPKSKSSEFAEQLKQQRPVVSSKLRSWLDEDDGVENKNAGIVANDEKEEATGQEVEDPMADLKATILNDLTKVQPERKVPPQQDAERLATQWENVNALEHEVLTDKEEQILSSVSTVKPLTKEETQQLDTVVAQAKRDELKEQADLAAATGNVNRNISMPLPDVELEEENPVVNDPNIEEPKAAESTEASQNSSSDLLLNSDNDEPIKLGIAEQLKQQRPVVSSKLQSWLDEDDEVEKKNGVSDANDEKEEATEQEVEDPMADLKATIQSDLTKVQPEREVPSQEDAERLATQWQNVKALGQDALTKEERDTLSDINRSILSSFTQEKVLTKDEIKQIERQVDQAKEDSLDENAFAFVPRVKADLHDVFLPDVELDEEEVNAEVKDQPIALPHSKALLYDDTPSEIDPDRITYDINESVINSGDESVSTHTVNMPAYNSYWIKHIEKDSVTQPVRSELNSILRAAGVKAGDASALADDIHGPLSQTVAFDNSINRNNIDMRDMAVKFFKDSYAAIDKANLGPKNRIIAAQNIADLMIRNYSPAAFVKGEELLQYADKYVAQNKSLLKDQLEKLNIQDVDKLIGDVDTALQNGFEYDKSEPLVDPKPEPNVNGEPHVANPDEASPKPRIPDFYQRLGERMESPDITERAMSEIGDIIRNAGIMDDKQAAELADASYSFVKKQINSIYDRETVPETKMSKDAPAFFRSAYESLNGSDLSTQAQIIAAQKIANVMLKNYSPVAFMEEELEHYANDYVLNNRDVFKSQLDMLRLHDAEALMDDVDAARGVNATVDAEDTEFTRWLNGRIDSEAVFGSVYNEVSDILQNAGFTDQDKLAELVRFTQYYGSRTIIDAPHLDGDNPNMHDIAVQFFEDSYQMIEGAGLSPKDRVIAAQKISDVMLKNYSPVGIEGEEFGRYANNYVLGNTTLLKERLEQLNVPDVDTLVTDRDIASISASENKAPDMVNGARLREKPSNFMLDRSRNGKALTNIRNILTEAGVGEDAAQSLEVVDILTDAYSAKNIPSDSISMRDVAKNIFVSTYGELTKKGLAPSNKIETTQKIADVILKNYSPIIRNRALNKYADNYVIGDGDLLKESLQALNVRESGEIVGVDEEKKLENVEQKAPENVNEQKEKPENPEKSGAISSEARVAVYTEKLNAFNGMYKLDLDANNFAASVTEAWELMTSGDKQKMADGQKVMNALFNDTLKKAFDVEKGVAYDEHRLPEYADIIKSTNELMRSAMYGFTDMYHNPNRKDLFAATAFGGLNAKDISELTTGKSFWSMDQKSDEAWDIQSKEAKNIADKWLEEDKPYEKMISEMNALIKDKKNDSLDIREAYNKLTAAEWLLINNEKMMVEDPEDPLNPIPNWGNRYWKSIISARDALGIPKHTSMRDLIQLDYAESAKAVENRAYNETQIFDGVLDPADREMHDSLEMQKEQFATRSTAVTLTKPAEKSELTDDMTADRIQYSVKELDERDIMKHEPKIYNFIVEQQADLELTAANRGQTK